MECENLRAAYFESITFSQTSEMQNTEDLSTNQKYLFAISDAVSTGQCYRGLENRKPGAIEQSRSITTVCRILRLYVSSSNPDEALKYLTQSMTSLCANMVAQTVVGISYRLFNFQRFHHMSEDSAFGCSSKWMLWPSQEYTGSNAN